jgi:hypothetical protein
MSENQRLWADAAELDARQHPYSKNGHGSNGLNGKGASNGHHAPVADPEKLFALSSLRHVVQSDDRLGDAGSNAARARLLGEISLTAQPNAAPMTKAAGLPFFRRMSLRTAVLAALIIITAAAAIAIAASKMAGNAESCKTEVKSLAVAKPIDPHAAACDFKTMKDDERPATPAKAPLK